MARADAENTRRISIDLPAEFIEGVDELKREWGLRARGAVFERLLEEVLLKDSESDFKQTNDNSNNYQSVEEEKVISENQYSNSSYSENKAIVLIGNSDLEIKELEIKDVNNETKQDQINNMKKGFNNSAIDLPGFVSKRTTSLRRSLGKTKFESNNQEKVIHTVEIEEIEDALLATHNHWLSLYGSEPGENVVEASMIWLARDIWPHIEGTENMPFTWTAACRLMINYCPTWPNIQPKFNRVIVTAGLLEDPFSSRHLKDRIPTLTRRFVNRFKRRNATSFQTLESTMTVIGALKILGLPTQAGASLTLGNIRDAYKEKALNNHPDAGGSTEKMRKLNEGYQLLKDLYKKSS